MNVSPNDKSAAQKGSSVSPTLLWPIAIGLGVAAAVGVVGSVILVIAWMMSADETTTVQSESLRSNSTATTLAPISETSAVAVDSEAPDSAEATRTENQIDEETSNATAQISTPIDFDNIPVIGGGRKVQRDASPQASSQVNQPQRLDVPFLVLGCAPSNDGHLLAVWGHDHPNEADASDTSPSQQQRPADSRLALVDLATRDVIATRSIAGVVTQVSLNATGVYVAGEGEPSKQEMPVLRLSLEDLKTISRSSILRGALLSVADKLLISEQPDHRGLRKYALPTLEPTELQVVTISNPLHPSPVRRVADGWLFEGALWTNDLTSPNLLTSLSDFQAVTTSRPAQANIVAVPIMHGYLTHAPSGKPPSSRDWRIERPRMPPDVPAVLTLRHDRNQIRLDFTEYHTGKLVRSAVITTGSSPRLANVQTTTDWIIVSLDRETFLLRAQSDEAPIDVPFRIEPWQSELVLSSSDPVKVNYRAKNATKYEFELPSLMTDNGYFKQQSSTGEFTIDVTAMVPNIVAALNESAQGKVRTFNGDLAKWAESYIEKVRSQFVYLTGREPHGVPLKVDAYVRAYGKDLTVAVLHHLYLLEIPLAEFERYRKEPLATLAARPTPTTKPKSVSPAPKRLPDDKTKSARLRTWTDTQGRTMQARFVEVDGDIVVVVDQSERTLRVPLKRLSETDREWLDEQISASDDSPKDDQ